MTRFLAFGALLAALANCAVFAVFVGALQPLLDQDAFCSPGYAAVADSVASEFDTHQFVFMGSTHGWKKQHDFQLCLLSRPAFQRRATDVMVEWANPVHQSLVDRYLLRLEPIPIDSLTPVWIDADAPDLWGRLTLMPAFYEAVRAINERLEPGRRIRVIGGGEPIDWSKVQTQEDVARYPYKSNWAAHLIMEHYALEPSRRLFVIYGEGHVNRRGALTAEARQKVSLDQWFMVGVIRERGADETLIARMGDPTQPFYAGTAKLVAAPPYPRDLSIARQQPLTSVMNAVVYLGPEPDRSMSHAVDLTPAQQAEVARRDQIKGDLSQLMRLRYGHRAEWFRSHPNDIPARPWPGGTTPLRKVTPVGGLTSGCSRRLQRYSLGDNRAPRLSRGRSAAHRGVLMSVEHVMFLSALIVGTLGFAHLALNVSRTGVPESGTRTCTGVT